MTRLLYSSLIHGAGTVDDDGLLTLLPLLLIGSSAVIATVAVGNDPVGVGVNPTTNRVYVANYSGNTVSVIDGASNTVIATIAVGSAPDGIGVNPVTNRVYVVNGGGDTVSVIDGASNTVIATIAVGVAPFWVGVNSVTNRVYVANQTSDTVSVIDGASNTVIATVVVGDNPWGVGVNSVTNRVYVGNAYGDTVSVIDGASNTVIATVVVGDNPSGVGVNSVTNRVYVGNAHGDTVSAIDGASNTVVATITVGDNPAGVSVNSTTDRIYVANFESNTVSVIDGSTNVVLLTVPVIGGPDGVSVNQITDCVYTANFTGNSVAVIAGAVVTLAIAADATLSGINTGDVTLGASAEALFGLTGQALSLDAQAAGTVVAGPVVGAAAAPTARALVVSDIPALAYARVGHTHGHDPLSIQVSSAHALRVSSIWARSFAEFDEEMSDPLNLISGYEGLTGVSAAFSDGGVLYLSIGSGGHDIDIYSDAARSRMVGYTSSPISQSGTVGITEFNGSGLGGTLYLVVGQEADDIVARWTIADGVLPPFPSVPVLDTFNRADEGPPLSASWITPATSDDGLLVADNAAVPHSAFNSCEAIWSPLSALQDTDVYATTLTNADCPAFGLALYARIQDTASLYTGCYGMLSYKAVGQPAKIALVVYSGQDEVFSPIDYPWVMGDSFGLRVITESSGLVRLRAYHKPLGGDWVEVHSIVDAVYLFTAGKIGFGLTGDDTAPNTFGAADNFGGGEVAYLPPFPSVPVLDTFNRADEGPPLSASWITPATSDDGLLVADNAAVPYSAFNSCEAIWSPLSALQDTDVYATTLVNADCPTFGLALYARIQSTTSLYTGCYGMLSYKDVGQPAKIALVVYSGQDEVFSPIDYPWVMGDSFGLRVITESSGLVRLRAYHKPLGGDWVEVHSIADAVYLFTAGKIGFGLTGDDTAPNTFGAADNFGGGEVVYGSPGTVFNVDTLTGETTIAKAVVAQLSTPSTDLVENLNADLLGGLHAAAFAPAFVSAAAALVYATPAAAAGVPSLRTLVASDIPALAYEASGAVASHAALTTGVHGLAITNGQTLTVTTGGTLVLAGATLTVPADGGTAALRNVDNTLTAKLYPTRGTDSSNAFIGDAGNVSVSGVNNTGIGFEALSNLTSGSNNFASGYQALGACLDGSNNFSLGLRAMVGMTRGSGNVGVGNYTLLQATTTSSENTAIGYQSSFGTIAGVYRNVTIGSHAGYTLSGSDNVFIGNCAGYYETGSSKLFIDNDARASEADARAKALIYGVFHSSPASQRLTVNALVGINTIMAGSGVTYLALNVNGALLFVGADSSQESPMTEIARSYVVNTHASYTTRAVFSQWAAAGAQEVMRLESGAAAMIGFLGAAAVARPAALTAQLTTITHTAPGTLDYALQDFAQNGGAGIWGFADHDEANTLLAVVANLQIRLAELEDKLGHTAGLGLITH